MDPKAFAAGLVEILSNYPPAILERAVSPSRGLAAFVPYPNLAKYRAKLEEWHTEHVADEQRLERANRKRLPEPAPDPEAEARIAKGLRDLANHLKSGFSPSSV
jgi:hypothetical protein